MEIYMPCEFDECECDEDAIAEITTNNNFVFSFGDEDKNTFVAMKDNKVLKKYNRFELDDAFIYLDTEMYLLLGLAKLIEDEYLVKADKSKL